MMALALSLPFYTIFLIQCEKLPFAGVNTDYAIDGAL